MRRARSRSLSPMPKERFNDRIRSSNDYSYPIDRTPEIHDDRRVVNRRSTSREPDLNRLLTHVENDRNLGEISESYHYDKRIALSKRYFTILLLQ